MDNSVAHNYSQNHHQHYQNVYNQQQSRMSADDKKVKKKYSFHSLLYEIFTDRIREISNVAIQKNNPVEVVSIGELNHIPMTMFKLITYPILTLIATLIFTVSFFSFENENVKLFLIFAYSFYYGVYVFWNDYIVNIGRQYAVEGVASDYYKRASFSYLIFVKVPNMFLILTFGTLMFFIYMMEASVKEFLTIYSKQNFFVEQGMLNDIENYFGVFKEELFTLMLQSNLEMESLKVSFVFMGLAIIGTFLLRLAKQKGKEKLADREQKINAQYQTHFENVVK